MYLDYNTHKSGVYVVDIETEEVPDFNPKVIWCLCWEDVLTGETGDCIGHDEIVSFFESRPDAIFIGHNGLKFDFRVLAEILGISLPISRVVDTLVLSMLYSPNIPGGHSLEQWGLRIGKTKGDFHDFTKFSQEMLLYCRQDVSITAEFFRRLIWTMARIGFTEQSVWIQHRFMALLNRQQRNGFFFNGEAAVNLLTTLRGKEQELLDDIRIAFPSERRLVATRGMYTKDGRLTAIYERDRTRYDIVPVAGDQYEAFEEVPFNVGSPKQRVDRLTALGWVPEEFTEKGGAKPFDKGRLSPSLERFLESHDVPEAKLMARYMTINGRANMINTWLNEWNQDDGCIHGKLFVADTLRLRHQSPNTANIPSVRTDEVEGVLYGDAGDWTYEARDVWTARPGRVLVGTDAAGLELRMLAHFLDRPAFTETVLNGDPHQFNADTVGISRPLAKTLLYAIQYGAQDKKVAKITGKTVKEGGLIRSQFLERLGLKGVMDAAIAEQKQGRIRLVDGSYVVCPSPHSALNYKLQGSGARVMALAAILLERSIEKEGLDSLKVGDIHDEVQYDVLPEHADRHAELAVEAIRESGRLLRLNIPLDATSKIGATWARTH